MTDYEIGALWRKPENYMQPLRFAEALLAAERERCTRKAVAALRGAAKGEGVEQLVAVVTIAMMDWKRDGREAKARG